MGRQVKALITSRMEFGSLDRFPNKTTDNAQTYVAVNGFPGVPFEALKQLGLGIVKIRLLVQTYRLILFNLNLFD